LAVDLDNFEGGLTKLRVVASDGLNNAIADSLEFIAGAPELSLSKSVIQFGKVELGHVETGTVTLRNQGKSELVITGITDPTDEAFRIVNGPAQIPPGGSRSLTVEFGPPEVGESASQITVASNDPKRRSVTIILKGSGWEREPPKSGGPPL
jgi:hypothetical protein